MENCSSSQPEEPRYTEENCGGSQTHIMIQRFRQHKTLGEIMPNKGIEPPLSGASFHLQRHLVNWAISWRCKPRDYCLSRRCTGWARVMCLLNISRNEDLLTKGALVDMLENTP